MTTSLALHHFTIADASPFELVSIAAETGCRSVCVFVNSPAEPAPGQNITAQPFPLITAASQQAMAKHLQACGVTITNIEFFPLAANTQLESFRPLLALGAELGARLAVTHVYDTDHHRAADLLARFSELAGQFELQVGLEFMGLSPACDSVQKALSLVQQAGQDNVGIAVDALHLQRTGGTPDDIKRIPSHLIAYAQLCDGIIVGDPTPALSIDQYLKEAFNRLAPGNGNFPLVELINALPSDTFFDIEVPSLALKNQGLTALQRARRAVNASHQLLITAGRTL